MYTSVSAILQNVPNLYIFKDEPMSRHTTFRIGGPCSLLLDAHSSDAAVQAINILNRFGLTPFILGKGSNLLVSDTGYDGIVLKLSCNKIEVRGNKIFAESGASLSAVANTAQKKGLSGFEFAHGIPGSVGGAVVMNAGAYGGEISQVLTTSTYVSETGVFSISLPEHNFGYRKSFYKNNPRLLVLSAEFTLSPGNPDEIAAKMRDLAERRREKQPLEFPSAGSVFKRPEGHFAGALIEQCGLKGYRIGGAEVSEKHAGFIINRENATAKDVRLLVEHIQKTVNRETGINLECEICFI
ncbi:MAG: UDP-N-acetylmuramate dehydrogenase [Ruminococcaceae bacterium]|nr:UDP-N-acetylmuramate dehydrogenase [Oscillospiraceae bacterium]